MKSKKKDYESLNELVELIRELPEDRQAAAMEYIRELDSATVNAMDAAKMIGVAQRTVLGYIESGKIHAEKNVITKKWMIKREEVEEFIAKRG